MRLLGLFLVMLVTVTAFEKFDLSGPISIWHSIFLALIMFVIAVAYSRMTLKLP